VWHWCPKHKSWIGHTASECKGINYKPKQETNSNRNVSESTPNPQLRLTQAMTAVSMFGYHSVEKETEETYLDFESGLGKPIKVDNCATCSISNDKRDFEDQLEPLNNTIKGIGGSIEGVSRGTIKWKIADDSGMHHALILPNSLYVPSSTPYLLSPQHWASEANDNSPNQRGTWCVTYENEVHLFWDQEKCCKRIKLYRMSGNGAATLYTIEDYQGYQAFCKECNIAENNPIAYELEKIT
jgi:hypothetical protein